MGKLVKRPRKSVAKTRSTSTPRAAAALPRPTTNGRRKPTLRQMNAWINKHHAELVEDAKENCKRLTGKPTF